MESTNRKSTIIIIGIIIGACLLITAAGVGTYFLVRSLAADALIETETNSESFNPTEINTPEIEPGNTPQEVVTEAAFPELKSLFEPFWLTRTLLRDNFYYQPVDDRVLADGAIQGLEQYLDSVDLSLDTPPLPEDTSKLENVARAAGTPEELIETYIPFWQSWLSLDDLDLPEEATQVHLMRQALWGMVSGLGDDYTNYFDPDLAEQYNIDLSGEYEGIGAWMDVLTEYLTVVSPMKGTPAEEAGLQPGDQVIAVDGEDMTGVDPSVVIKRVLGPAGTKVILTLRREGIEEDFDVPIIREKIEIPYIESKMLEGNIGYISLATFYDGGEKVFEEHLIDLLANDPVGLIVDLRSNGGGYVHVAIDITSDFITEGNVLIEEFNDGSTKDFPVLTRQGMAADIPLVILVNQGTASASEIVTGALSDYGRATIIGMKTFGKGVVQLPIDLPDDQGMVSITHALWLTPNGNHIHEVGIEPDIVVDFTEDDFNAGLDPQLDRAVEFLLTGE